VFDALFLTGWRFVSRCDAQLLCASVRQDVSCHFTLRLRGAEVRTGQGRNPFKRLAAAVADAFSAVRAGVPNWRRCARAALLG